MDFNMIAIFLSLIRCFITMFNHHSGNIFLVRKLEMKMYSEMTERTIPAIAMGRYFLWMFRSTGQTDSQSAISSFSAEY